MHSKLTPFPLLKHRNSNSMATALNVPTPLPYLRHLDGLRAIAVFYVLLFHFHLYGATGGYLGVDMFLVLSGFLMTRIIVRNVSTGNFSFRAFIVRRFWRLYPSLLVTVSGTLFISLFLFPPRLQEGIGASSLAVLLSVSNEYFRRTSGYFDLKTELKPLMHTWSLSLEEQFYVFWPLLITAINRLHVKPSRSIPVVMGMVAVLSFQIATILKRQHSFVFFALPSRVFEFAVGGIISHFYSDIMSRSNRQLQNIISTIGLILVNYPMFYPSESNLPGPSAIPTLLGTLLLIITPESEFSVHVLSSRPFRYVGKLSYALYLVHWPIAVYAPFFSSSKIWPATLVSITAICAMMLHYCVEQPCRLNRRSVHQIVAAGLLVLTLSIAAKSYATGGLPSRMKYARYSVDYLRDAHAYKSKKCPWTRKPRGCTIGTKKSLENPTAIVVGSSYAGHYEFALRLLASKHNYSFWLIWAGNCPPVFTKTKGVKNAPECDKENEYRGPFFRRMPPTRVIVADIWSVRIAIKWDNGNAQLPTFRRYLLQLKKDLEAMGHTLSIVIEPPLLQGITFAQREACRFRNTMLPVSVECPEAFEMDDMRRQFRYNFQKMLKSDSQLRKIPVIDVAKEFCDMSGPVPKCREMMRKENMIVPDGVDPERVNPVQASMFNDGYHLGPFGSWRASKAIEDYLMQSSQKFSNSTD